MSTTPSSEISANKQQIIFFDGICGLCNKSVDFIIKRDKKRIFKYAPLQGITAQLYLPEEDTKNLNSIVLLKNGLILYKSRAIIEICISLGGIYSILYIGKIVPTFFSDYIYTLIAKNRYRWFGKKESCRLPQKEERNLFLD